MGYTVYAVGHFGLWLALWLAFGALFDPLGACRMGFTDGQRGEIFQPPCTYTVSDFYSENFAQSRTNQHCS